MRLTKLTPFTLSLDIEGTRIEVSGLSRGGTGVPLVFLHGFGSTKEDYVDVIQRAELSEYPVIVYDAPGCGQSTVSDPDRVDIALLVEVARRVVAERSNDRVHLIGHSMGGLTALQLALSAPQRVASFVDIEGNLAPEDCFLSRQIVDHPRDTAQDFFDEFRARVAASRFAGSAVFAAGLPAKVQPEVVRPIFQSMVDMSDNAPLLDGFLALPFPRMLMYGQQNAGLSYLHQLATGGVELAEIPCSGHFPMYSNPPAMWDRISDLVRRADALSSRSSLRRGPRSIQ